MCYHNLCEWSDNMEIRIDDLMQIQDSLDSRIFSLHDTSRTKTREDRILALLVEAGELANETRCFKYWSVQKPSEDAVIFEEFSDVVHFSLSLGIDIGFDEEVIGYHESEASLNDQFHLLYRSINAFSLSNTKEDYRHLLEVIFTLSHKLGMDAEAIRQMYLYKNKKNHQRQDDNY